jgi:hypothetical protein
VLAPESAAFEAPGIDPFSDVLRAVRLTGAVFFRVDATSPWVIEVPDTSALASVTLPRAQDVISYHVMTHGGVRPIHREDPYPRRTPIARWTHHAAHHAAGLDPRRWRVLPRERELIPRSGAAIVSSPWRLSGEYLENCYPAAIG